MCRLFNILHSMAPLRILAILFAPLLLVACTNNAYEGRADSQSYAAIVSKAPLVPGMTEQIFIDDELIGGCDELYELEFDGELDAKLGLAGA